MINHQYYFGRKVSILAVVAAAGNAHGSTWAVRLAHEEKTEASFAHLPDVSHPSQNIEYRCVCAWRKEGHAPLLFLARKLNQ